MNAQPHEPAETRSDENRDVELPDFLAHPEPADRVLIFALLGMGIFSLAMIAPRAWFLSHPMVYSLVIGGYTSATISGANVFAGNGHWWLYLGASLIGALKFMPVYWLMGKRWGHDFVEMSLQYMPRARKFFNRALKNETGRSKAITLGLIPLGFMPGPVPANILNAVAGLLKIRFSLTMLVNVLSVLAVNGLFMWLGFTFGDQVLSVVQTVNKYMLWVTLALIAFIIFKARKKTAT